MLTNLAVASVKDHGELGQASGGPPRLRMVTVAIYMWPNTCSATAGVRMMSPDERPAAAKHSPAACSGGACQVPPPIVL